MEMRDLDELFAELKQSAFRRRFHLRETELAYLRQRGLPEILAHAAAFIEQRLAPAFPRNDGRQTPYRNHPAFVAQHATATCCRGCLEKWHGIPRGRELSSGEKDHVLAALERWLRAAGEISTQNRFEDRPMAARDPSRAVILDTNVFVAAGFNPGSHSARILEGVRAGALRLVWNNETRRETERIVRKIPPLSWASVAALFREEDRCTAPTDPHRFLCVPDPEDRKFAALCEAAGAPLVTSDAHLLEARQPSGLPILTPGEFLRGGFESRR
jgi:predicted nucleic acid-binding protein